MARSPFTLAAAVTAALPEAEVVGTRVLTAGGDGRFDSAVITLADGSEVAIRVGDDDETARELAAESIALRALTPGARAMLPFQAPEYRGETLIADGRALVTGLLPGFQIEAADIPAGRGAAESMGTAIAALHALPASVVRGAGLPARSSAEVREEIRQLVDRAAATGRVPARLTVRWREAVDDDDLWRFESAVVLGGTEAKSFIFDDDDELGPRVTGIVHWNGLSIGDPAADLAWLSAAPDAEADVHAAYAAASTRSPDPALVVRARMLAELEFARWLLHGESLHRDDIMNDAAGLLEALAQGLRERDLSVIAARADGVESALDALDRVPATPETLIDTSMQTDAYNPEDLLVLADLPETAPADVTEDLREVAESDLIPEVTDEKAAPVELADTVPVAPTESREAAPRRADGIATDDDPDADPAEEAQRAARAALQRWTSSSSE